MKLLVVSYYLPPLVNPQAAQVGRLLYHLPSRYRIYCATCRDDDHQQDPDLYPDLFDKFEGYLRLRASRKRLAGRFRFPANILRWHARAFWRILLMWRKTRFDGIVTFSAPMSSNILGWGLKRVLRRPWIAFLSDPWVDNKYELAGKMKRLLAPYFERAVMKTADLVVLTCPEARDFYRRKYPSFAVKMTHLEHSYDEQCYRGRKGDGNDGIILRHIGTLYGDRDPSTLIKALVRVKDKATGAGKIVFEIVGQVEEKYVQVLSDAGPTGPGGSRVRLRSPVSYGESLRLMKDADVLVAIDMLCDDNIYLMSKLIDYIGAKRPIIAIAPESGATARIIQSVGGWHVRPDDVDGMTRILELIADRHEKGVLADHAPRLDAAGAYAVENQVGKFVEMLDRNFPARQER